MDKLTNMKVFIYVVEQEQLSQRHNTSTCRRPWSVNMSMSWIRTTSQLIPYFCRKQSLTVPVNFIIRNVKRILEDINAENPDSNLGEPTWKGTVKINCPVTYGNKVLAPIVAKFLARITND